MTLPSEPPLYDSNDEIDENRNSALILESLKRMHVLYLWEDANHGS
jgi:hypothetical protein